MVVREVITIAALGALVACGKERPADEPGSASAGRGLVSSLDGSNPDLPVELLLESPGSGPMIYENRARLTVVGRGRCAGPLTWGLTVRLDTSFERARDLFVQITSLRAGVSPVPSTNDSYEGFDNSRGLFKYPGGSGTTRTWCFNTGGGKTVYYAAVVYGDVIRVGYPREHGYIPEAAFPLTGGGLTRIGDGDVDPEFGDLYLAAEDSRGGGLFRIRRRSGLLERVVGFGSQVAGDTAVTVPFASGGVAFDPDLDRVYVGRFEDPETAVFAVGADSASAVMLGAVGGEVLVAAVAPAAFGELAGHVFLGTQAGVVFRLDPSSGASSTFATLDAPVVGLDFSPDGRLFAAAERLWELSESGHAVLRGPAELRPRGVDFNEAYGNLLVADSSDDCVCAVDVETFERAYCLARGVELPEAGQPMLLVADGYNGAFFGSSDDAFQTPGLE